MHHDSEETSAERQRSAQDAGDSGHNLKHPTAHPAPWGERGGDARCDLRPTPAERPQGPHLRGRHWPMAARVCQNYWRPRQNLKASSLRRSSPRCLNQRSPRSCWHSMTDASCPPERRSTPKVNRTNYFFFLFFSLVPGLPVPAVELEEEEFT